jgi:hypothetical protein
MKLICGTFIIRMAWVPLIEGSENRAQICLFSSKLAQRSCETYYTSGVYNNAFSKREA